MAQFRMMFARSLLAAVAFVISCALPAIAVAQNYTLNTRDYFVTTNGRFSVAGLYTDAAGNLFGTAREGGTNGDGTVFELAAGSSTIVPLASFNGANGEFPKTGVLGDASGNLYGTTDQGGANNKGALYEVAAGSGTITTLVSFDNTNGAYPYAGLIADASGNLYGTTEAGGANGDGTVFEIAAGTHTLTTLASFNGANGNGPQGGVIADAHGNLYGTTLQGGAHNQGTVFEIAAGSGTITTLASFNATNGSTGYSPHANLVADASGNLYGTTKSGGPANDGTVFKLAAGTNTLSTLFSFNGANGELPWGLVADAAGNIYGTTTEDSSGAGGTVFKIAAGSNTLTTLVSFDGYHGDYPEGGVIIDARGNLYGTTEDSVGFGYGTVFELSPPTTATLTTGSNRSATTGGGLQNVGATQLTLPQVTTAGTFSGVFSEPKTSADLQQAIGAPAAGSMQFSLPGATAQLWQLNFSGAFTGLATVTLHFDPALLGNTPLSQLFVEHYENGAWVIPAGQVIDPVADTITFTTDGFSPFVLAAVPEPGTETLTIGGALVVAAFVARRRSR